MDIDLTNVQRQILSVLVNKYQQSESPVKGKDLAEAVDLHEGTIRKQMGNLTALNLAESIRGPKGGYRPTSNAYDVLDREQIEEPEELTLSREFQRVAVTVDEISLFNVHHPEKCKARLHFQEAIGDYEAGDAIAVGPTPVSRLVLAGQIEAVDESTNEVIVSNVKLEAPVEQ